MSLDLKDIKIVESESFIFTLFNFLFLILPGVAIIYIFNNELFINADWIKIILISGAVTAPLVLVNTFILVTIFMCNKKSTESSLFISFSLSVLLSGLILYTNIALHYIFEKTFRSGVYFTFAIEFILIVIMGIRLKGMRKK
ncbi:MAG: hypothetical protein QG640_698 [Patescibacteria group bacterium]|nr:hypothetical protein [Patescibacteria group bacterium]